MGSVDGKQCRLLSIDVAVAASGSAQLLRLHVEGLSVGADAGTADGALFGASFGHNLRQR
jgi:hypothetical protein